MKKTFFSILCLLFTATSVIAQDQVVNGKLTTKEYIVAGQQVSPNNYGEVIRLAITPYRHTGGPWTINSRDTLGVAYLNLNYGSIKDIISIKHEGNIGIGNSDPTYKLDVSGDIRMRNLILPPRNMITPYPSDKFTYNTINMGHYAIQWVPDPWNHGGNSFWVSGYGGIKLFTAGQPRLSINGAGNVGIGGENPQYKLQVFGDLSVGDQSRPDIVGAGNRLYLGGVADNTDAMWIAKYNTGVNRSDLRINIGDDAAGDDRFLIGNIFSGDNNWYSWFSVVNNGNVGIGTDSPQNKLDVKGTIRATEVKVEAGWADFVFDKDYKLPTLQEVEDHINEHKHLPDIPSEAEVKENGVSLGEMQAKLLQKIEELTLYTIELNKTVKEQGELIQELRDKRK